MLVGQASVSPHMFPYPLYGAPVCVSLDGSGQRDGSYGAGAGLGQSEDVHTAAGLRSWADLTSPADSGSAIHQEQHTAARQPAVQREEEGGGRRKASPRRQLGRDSTCAQTDKNSHYQPRGQQSRIFALRYW